MKKQLNGSLLNLLTNALGALESECEWALEGPPCDLSSPDAMCQVCQQNGCIRSTIDGLRAEIDKAMS